MKRYRKRERITPRLIWENVASQFDADAYGYVLFDNIVIDKRHSFAIELVRRQRTYSRQAFSRG